MAKADSRPKAIIKAAIRSKCHVIARRYPSQQLDTLHGSNVKWLVLSDELFDEVCSEFTIKKLELSHEEKRALFDADWVPQVTYELITKPARPRRRHATQQSMKRSESTEDCAHELAHMEIPDTSAGTPSIMHTPNSAQVASPNNRHSAYASSRPTLGSIQDHSHPSRRDISTSHNEAAAARPAWFDTVLN